MVVHWSSYDGIVSGGAINSKECNIPSDLLRIISNCHNQCDCAERVYFCSSKPNEWRIGWNQTFFVDPHLLKRWVVENVHGASVVNQDPICVIVSYLDANKERVVMRVVKTSSVFF